MELQLMNKSIPIRIVSMLAMLLLLPAVVAQTNEALPESSDAAQASLNAVNILAKDGFVLAGEYFPGLSNASGVLLLHDCNRDHMSYKTLVPLLAKKGLNTLAFDFRGYGASVSNEFSHQRIRRIAKDLSTYQTEVSALKAYWKDDVLSAYLFLRERIEKEKDVAVVSLGCSAVQAIELAESMRINSFVMITPELNYMQRETFKNLIDIPVYFIDSVYHVNSYQTTKELFEWNGDSRSVFQIFKGSKHGHSLLNGKNYVAEDIALWLDDTLAK